MSVCKTAGLTLCHKAAWSLAAVPPLRDADLVTHTHVHLEEHKHTSVISCISHCLHDVDCSLDLQTWPHASVYTHVQGCTQTLKNTHPVKHEKQIASSWVRQQKAPTKNCTAEGYTPSQEVRRQRVVVNACVASDVCGQVIGYGGLTLIHGKNVYQGANYANLPSII